MTEAPSGFPQEHLEFLRELSEPIFLIVGTHCRFANQAAARLLGYASAAELQDLPLAGLAGAEDVAAAEQQAEAAQRGERSTPVPLRLRCADGSDIAVETVATPFPLAGEPAALTLVRDAKARAAARAVLVSRTVLEGSPDSIYVVDAARMRFIDVNETACRTLGYTRDQLLERGPADINPLRDRSFFAEMARRVQQEGPMIYNAYHGRSDGSLVPVEIHARSVTVDGRNYIVAIARDLTARVQDWNVLRESEERFRFLFGFSPVGLAFIDPEMRFMRVNQRLCEMLGYSMEELIGRSVFDVTHPEDAGKTGDRMQGLISGGRELIVETRYLHRSGQVIWAQIRVLSIRTAGGAPRYQVAIIEDISERRAREEARLAETRSHYKALIREVHHRIKNNLQGVAGLLHAQLAGHPPLQEVLRQAVSQVKSIAAAHGLISATEERDLSLSFLLHDIVHNGAQLGGRPIGLEGDCEGKAVRGEYAVPMALVLNEIIWNALKHGLAEAPIRVRVASDPGEVCITVCNRSAHRAPVRQDQTPPGGSGLSLVSSLLPRTGATFELVVRGEEVIATLRLHEPLISGG